MPTGPVNRALFLMSHSVDCKSNNILMPHRNKLANLMGDIMIYTGQELPLRRSDILVDYSDILHFNESKKHIKGKT
jgi:hypothetical protein